MPPPSAPKTVLVTGANGFIGSHICAQLLARGHTVVASVRDPTKAAHLSALPGASDRLRFVVTDLLDAATFPPAVAGCDVVVHTASPYIMNARDPQRDLVEPAVNGTLNVLKACAGEPRVRRVVLTSSMAAITDEPPKRALTEADWNISSSLTRNPYYYSKTQAELAAWEFVGKPRGSGGGASKPAAVAAAEPVHFDLVVLNPILTTGPSLGPGQNETNDTWRAICAGEYPGIMQLSWGVVDVRDVAQAHVAAVERPSAQGRYILLSESLTMRDVVDHMRDIGCTGPGYKLPTVSLDSACGSWVVTLASYAQPAGVGSYLRSHLGRAFVADSSKAARDLMDGTWRPARAAIAAAIADMVAKGLMPVPAAPLRVPPDEKVAEPEGTAAVAAGAAAAQQVDVTA